MRTRLVMVVLLVVALVSAWDTAPVAACSCSQVSDQEAMAQSDAVFVGVVERAPTIPTTGTWSSTDPGVWRFAVESVHKGTVAPDQEVVSALSGASCGLELPEQGRVVVFARTEPRAEALEQAVAGATLYADLCGGSRALAGPPPAELGVPYEPVVDAGPAIGLEPVSATRHQSQAMGPILIGVGAGAALVAVAIALVVSRRRPT
jgi:hypothetical protein